MLQDPRRSLARVSPAVFHKLIVTALLIIGSLTVGVSGPTQNAFAAPPETEADSKTIQGEWKCVEAFENGKSYKVPAGIIWVFAGDRLTILLEGRKQHSGTFALTPSSTPPAIDMRLKGETANNSDSDKVGIYKLEKNKLTVCVGVNDASDKRPTTFNDSQEFPTSSVILERVGAAERKE